MLVAMALQSFQLVRDVEHLHQLRAAPVGHPHEIAAFEAVLDGDHGGRV